MDSKSDDQIGICYECSTKDMDSSQKKVYSCDLCKKWFCEKHQTPKFPYFVDWDTVFDVQGDPKMKALFHTEYKLEGGHPDFIYWRKTIEATELEEKTRNELIKQAIDKMMQSERLRNGLSDEEKRLRLNDSITLKEIYQKNLMQEKEKKTKKMAIGQTTTTQNWHGFRFVVPLEVYSNAEYREYLNNAQTMKSVKVIVDEYYRKFHKRADLKEPAKKKHWWQ